MVDNVENVSISVENNNNSSLNITRYKIVFIGDVSVGKTSILNRFLENKFSDEYQVKYFKFKTHFKISLL
jgi:GTPase SAR1 family protein